MWESPVRRKRSKLLLVLAAALAMGAFAATGALAAIISGTEGDDTIRGNRQADIIAAHGGNDTVFPEAGPDVVSGGEGADTLCQSAGSDELDGGPGLDVITDADASVMPGGTCSGTAQFDSKNDVDVLFGKHGNDALVSADGDGLDVLHGGPDFDRCFVDPTDIVRFGCEQVTTIP
jgi:Ca2+-binding RTX toxin-like protein